MKLLKYAADEFDRKIVAVLHYISFAVKDYQGSNVEIDYYFYIIVEIQKIVYNIYVVEKYISNGQT